MKIRKAIIILCLFVFVLIYAGCVENQVTKSEGTAYTQNESAIKQKDQSGTNEKAVKQNNVKEEQTTKKQATSESIYNLKDIHFDFDQYSLREEDKQILSNHADYLLKNKTVKIVIEGNCDERGTTEYNLALGDRRAQEAKKFLLNSGIDSKMIKTISYGKERPLDPAHNEEAWAKNRRDHFIVK
jgi:peptidoglycan-associated lipoprotein